MKGNSQLLRHLLYNNLKKDKNRIKVAKNNENNHKLVSNFINHKRICPKSLALKISIIKI